MTTSTPAPIHPPRGSIRQFLDRGVHPATLAPLLDSDLSNPSAFCGGCAHSVLKQHHDGQDRLKCGLRPRSKRGLRGPDLRDTTPACVKYADPAASPPGT
ncbi:hypothetical protein ABZ896_23065 [Streptomyces sp. NPDC047072]|uniref:hypothetical protein n=1 Tax=Streptomyces sp. NPDC047072 TaxID=3154809 RepID=UPI0033D0F3DD